MRTPPISNQPPLIAATPASTAHSGENEASLSAQVVIVGASLAGCICALALAEQGWKVHLLEQRQNAGHYKKLCTHIIHPSGVQSLRKLEVWDALTRKSASPSHMRIYHDSHWLSFPFRQRSSAANIERKDIDPLLREKIETHQKIVLHRGYRLTEVVSQDDCVSGIVARNTQQQSFLRIDTPLLIAADGREGTTAQSAGAIVRRHENNRVALFAYFDHGEAPAYSQVWVREKGHEYIGCFPNQTHILVSWYISRQQYDQIKHQKDAAFLALSDFLSAQGVQLGTQQSPVMAATQTSEQIMHGGPRGFTAIGDAKLAADPLTGVGCAWAIASAEKLAACLGAPCDHAPHRQWALKRYHLWHKTRLSVLSRAMSLASMHGPWIFNKAVFPLLARLSGGQLTKISQTP